MTKDELEAIKEEAEKSSKWIYFYNPLTHLTEKIVATEIQLSTGLHYLVDDELQAYKLAYKLSLNLKKKHITVDYNVHWQVIVHD